MSKKRHTDIHPLVICGCGQSFRQQTGEHYKTCLDCRLSMAERARRPHGQRLDEYFRGTVGYKLIRGFSLLSRGMDNQ